MPIQRYLREAAFGPESIQAVVFAFEDTLRELKLVDRDDPLVEEVARIIIDCARRGHRGPAQMRDCALAAIRNRKP